MEYRNCTYCKTTHQLTAEYWHIYQYGRRKTFSCRIQQRNSARERSKPLPGKDGKLSSYFQPESRYRKGVWRARDAGLIWNVSFEHYVNLIDKLCEYCGEPVSPSKGFSLDRKDNSLGYLPDNVVPCCGRCNKIKNNLLSHAEMKAAMAAILELHKNNFK